MQHKSAKTKAPIDAKLRAALIKAGYQLCKTCTLAELNSARLVETTGCSEQEFKACFGSLKQYFLALQLNFLDELRAKIVAATMKCAPGAERLASATAAYLDGCLAQRQLRVWLLDLRANDAEIQDSLAKRNKVYCDLLKIEFDSLGVRHSAAAARLFMSMTQEASYAEHQANQVLPDMRETMNEYLRALAPSA